MAQKNSKTLSFIGENIKKIRMAKNISQADFAKLFDLARASVGAYEEGRSEPKIDTIIQIANTFRLSIDVLLKRELTVGEIYSFGQLNEKLNRAHKLTGEQKMPDLSMDIRWVREEEFVNYIVRRENQDFLRSLPHIKIPFVEGRDLLAFEVKGSKMQFQNQGIHHGDILVAKRLDPATESSLNKVVVVVTRKEILFRRLVSFGPLKLKCDDPTYSTEELEEFLEIWEARAIFSKQLHAPSQLEERVLRLENLIDQLKN